MSSISVVLSIMSCAVKGCDPGSKIRMRCDAGFMVVRSTARGLNLNLIGWIRAGKETTKSAKKCEATDLVIMLPWLETMISVYLQEAHALYQVL